MSAIQTIEINETTRVKVYQDEDISFDLLGDGVGIFSLDEARGLRQINIGERESELANLVDSLDYVGISRRDSADALIKHLNRAGYNADVVTLQGYSQGEWANVIIYSEYELKPMIEEVMNIWRGDVYCLVLEKFDIWQNSDGQERGIWDAVDSIGGIMLRSDQYTFERSVIMGEYFDLVA